MKLCMLNNCLQCFKVSLRTLTTSDSHLFHDCTNVVNVNHALPVKRPPCFTVMCDSVVYIGGLSTERSRGIKLPLPCLCDIAIGLPLHIHIASRDGCDRTVSKLKTLLHLTSIWRVF